MKGKYIHVSNVHISWGLALIVCCIISAIFGEHVGKWSTVSAYRDRSHISRDSVYNPYHKEIVTTTTIRVPHGNEKALPWLTNPKTLSQRILCGFPTITVVEHIPCVTESTHNTEEDPVEPEEVKPFEEESSPNTPAPEPQYIDPTTFAAK